MEHQELKILIDRYTSATNEVNRRITQRMNEQVHQQLTTDQFSTLHYMYKHQPCTSSDISHEFSIGKSAVTAQINRLFERGFIRRNRDNEDRRIVYLSLTNEGKELMEHAISKLYDVLGDILTQFDQEEVESFIQKLEKLVQILKDNGN
ncbi:MarR family winged helix-turn-helix transcriptional regulator [Aquibacillus sp. 3ASR75-11]|uniref:MarR family winged helix-turn-helix transcriptional regulator n=1 Tax=Terrihalobacillus insolitus TaxID=2950438 RepID=A0A9X3WTM3_9BACI|nr:MarR family winged helix-turn-helix transcriptional regulator [Terrihalobacillus insolitus]MDC3413610.1 MarR family winged helix-turn-helix transcriptional regulator [Terrihalobacillus insolitus]MDC3424633.1 MarR family winged helix-turn-helix transcriptional regulator [Terrihalobacillus insolitus]